MNDPLGIDPPAHVREHVAKLSLPELAKKYRRRMRRRVDNGIEDGELMVAIFAQVTGQARKDFLRQEFNISTRTAERDIARFKNRDKTREKPSDTDVGDDALSPELAEAMRLEEEADSPQEVAPTGSVPFAPTGQPAKPPETAPEREPGDMTEEEEEQDRRDTELAAKIQAVLCKDCKRKGVSCNKCRAAIYKLQNPSAEAEKPKRPTAPAGPKNGQVAVDWKVCADLIKKMAGFIQQSFSFYDAENSPEAESCRAKLEEAIQFFRAEWERKAKQKAPGGMR